MNLKRNLIFLLAALPLLSVSCGQKPDPVPETNPAPELVSTDPADGVSTVDGSSLTVTFTFDQNIQCPQSAQAGISVSGGALVSKVEAYGTALTVNLSALTAATSYTLTLPEGTVKGYRTNQAASAAITFHFSTVSRAPVPGDPGTDPTQWEKAAAAVVNMGVGWNLGNTLDSNSGDVNNMWIEAFSSRTTSDYETAWGQPVATRELIHMFKEAGFNAIRVPVTWFPHIGTVTVSQSKDSEGNWHGIWDKSTWAGNNVNAAWMARVKEVVNYVIDEGMYCILNVHHDTGTATTAWLRADDAVYAASKDRYISLWTQIATEFQSYNQQLVFESFNEMLDSGNNWNAPASAASYDVINRYNADFVATVRATGGNNAYRNLILNTYAASTQKETLEAFQLPKDSVEGHLMAEVHSYAPYHFAFATSTPKRNFDASCESEVKGIIDGLNTCLVSRGIPVVLGEYGSDTSDREEAELAKQAKCYVSNAARYNIPCFYWMSLSDGDDRKIPKWTKPVLKNAILQAYQDSKK